jgi:hypothetical protein
MPCFAVRDGKIMKWNIFVKKYTRPGFMMQSDSYYQPAKMIILSILKTMDRPI